MRSELVSATANMSGRECLYDSSHDPPAEWPNAVELTMTDAGTADAALQVQDFFKEFAGTAGHPLSSVPGTGDSAFAYDEGEYTSYIQAVRGPFVVEVRVADSGNDQVPEVPSAQKVAYGAEILRYALDQIPE
jgi:hypothetical protein